MALAKELDAWEYNPTDEDQRLEHKFAPSRPVTSDRLAALGVLSWKIDVDGASAGLDEIKSARGYLYCETITVAPDKLENYEEKLARFFHEHLHPYDESRLILEGSGYWDIRDYSGEWIRFRVEKGDLIVLPPGMYHRFTLDTHNYIKVKLSTPQLTAQSTVVKSPQYYFGLHISMRFIPRVLSAKTSCLHPYGNLHHNVLNFQGCFPCTSCNLYRGLLDNPSYSLDPYVGDITFSFIASRDQGVILMWEIVTHQITLM